MNAVAEVRTPSIDVSAKPAQGSVVIAPQIVAVKAEEDSLGIILGNPIIREFIGGEPYEGEYEITPSMETQTLSTSNKLLARDVTVNPIPSNYGLITWNGSTLTVS